MPRSLLEAGAIWLPVVTTDVTGCRNVIEDGYQWSIVWRKKQRFSIAGNAENDGKVRRGAKENGRALVSERYCEDLVENATISAIEAAVKNKQAH